MFVHADPAGFMGILMVIGVLWLLFRLFEYTALLSDRNPKAAKWAGAVGAGFMGSLAVWLFYPINPWGLSLLTLIFAVFGAVVVGGLVGFFFSFDEVPSEATSELALAGKSISPSTLNASLTRMVDAAARLSGKRDADASALKAIRDAANWVATNHASLGEELARPETKDRARRVVKAIVSKSADDGITISEIEAAFGIASN